MPFVFFHPISLESCSIFVLGFLFCVRPLKIREEADPFSVDVGVVGKGDIVKVLEVSATMLWGYPPLSCLVREVYKAAVSSIMLLRRRSGKCSCRSFRAESVELCYP